MSTDPSCRSSTSANTRTDRRSGDSEGPPKGQGPIRACGRSGNPAARRPIGLPILAVLLGLFGPAGSGRAEILEEIVAKVNNRIITKSEFEERSQYVLKQVYREHSGSDLDHELKSAQDTMLANMITELLLIERAQNLLDLDKVRKNLVDDFRKQQKIDSDEDLEKLLKEQGMTRKDLEEQLIRLAVPQEVINYEVKRKISVSEREIKDYYDAHIADYESGPTVTLREIVLFYEPVSRAEALSRAQGILRELKGGADFLDLVQRYSEGGTKETGGLLDPMKASDLHSQISRAAFALDVNEVSEPIDTGSSFHIVRVEGKTPRVVKTMAEVHDAIYDAIREKKFHPRYDTYLKKIWQDSHVEVNPKYDAFLVVSPIKPRPGT